MGRPSDRITPEHDRSVVTTEAESIEQRRFHPAFLHGAADSMQGTDGIGLIIVGCGVNLSRVNRQHGRDAPDGSSCSQGMADK